MIESFPVAHVCTLAAAHRKTYAGCSVPDLLTLLGFFGFQPWDHDVHAFAAKVRAAAPPALVEWADAHEPNQENAVALGIEAATLFGAEIPMESDAAMMSMCV